MADERPIQVILKQDANGGKVGEMFTLSPDEVRQLPPGSFAITKGGMPPLDPKGNVIADQPRDPTAMDVVGAAGRGFRTAIPTALEVMGLKRPEEQGGGPNYPGIASAVALGPLANRVRQMATLPAAGSALISKMLGPGLGMVAKAAPGVVADVGTGAVLGGVSQPVGDALSGRGASVSGAMQGAKEGAVQGALLSFLRPILSAIHRGVGVMPSLEEGGVAPNGPGQAPPGSGTLGENPAMVAARQATPQVFGEAPPPDPIRQSEVAMREALGKRDAAALTEARQMALMDRPPLGPGPGQRPATILPSDRPTAEDALYASMREKPTVAPEVSEGTIQAAGGDLRAIQGLTKATSDIFGQPVRSTGQLHDLLNFQAGEDALRTRYARGVFDTMQGLPPGTGVRTVVTDLTGQHEAVIPIHDAILDLQKLNAAAFKGNKIDGFDQRVIDRAATLRDAIYAALPPEKQAKFAQTQAEYRAGKGLRALADKAGGNIEDAEALRGTVLRNATPLERKIGGDGMDMIREALGIPKGPRGASVDVDMTRPGLGAGLTDADTAPLRGFLRGLQP